MIATTLAVVFGALGTAAASNRHAEPKPTASDPQPAQVARSVGGATHEPAPPPTATPARTKGASSPKPTTKAKPSRTVEPQRKHQEKPRTKPARTAAPNRRAAPNRQATPAERTTATSRVKDRADRNVRRTPPPSEAAWVRPGTGQLSSGFGARWGTFHYGIDLAAPYGAPIYAAGDGVVLRAGPSSGFGLAVYIQHENGDVTVYGHEYEVLVSAGQSVKAGQLIAHVGSEGYSTGPHLHFGVYQGGLEGPRIDPIPWLEERGVTI